MDAANQMPAEALSLRKNVTREGNCTVTSIISESGSIVKYCYSVFPGITLTYNDVNMQQCRNIRSDGESAGNLYEISHCRQGRIETRSQNHFYYLSPGDLSIHKSGTQGSTSYFPTSHYHGICIQVDVDHAPRCLSCLLADVDVRPDALMEKFCEESGLFIARSNEHLSRVFSELYHIPAEIRTGYLKIKVLEIFLFLSSLSPVNQEEQKAYSPSQVTLAKQVCQYLMARRSDHVTINELSDVFHVSPSQLKNCFKGVYGVSLYSYIRNQKMHSAASMLLATDKTVLEVANAYSYDNASKFARAFTDVMGLSPKEYRKAHMGLNY